ncbi:MAG: phosphoribosylglycinamide formyltransferase [Bacillota bacterium]|jgi:phosphoribosylglycinamide formyltransferase-1
MTVRLAVLVSGGGTNLQAIIDSCEAGQLAAEVAVVVSTRRQAFALQRAERHGIPTVVVSRKRYGDDLHAFSQAVLQAVSPYQPDLVLLAGFMSVLTEPFISAYAGRIMNTHPALIPAFAGPGFYGQRVHQAVLDYGVKVSGATIIFVEAGVDSGPIILQEAVPVYDDDTVDSLSSRVLQVEHRLYVQAVKLFSEGRLRLCGRRVRILPEKSGEVDDHAEESADQRIG